MMHYKCTYQGWEVPTQLEKLKLYFGVLFCQPEIVDTVDTVKAMDGERRPADSALQPMNSGLQRETQIADKINQGSHISIDNFILRKKTDD